MSSEDTAAYASLMAGIAALVMVAFGLRQLRLLREQNRSSQRASAAAVEAADAARAAVTETARTRADTFAPRITVLPEKPQWPPLISRHASRGDRLFSSGIVHGAEQLGLEELIFPESAGHLMWFVVRSVLTNEGASTARVRIMGDGEFIEGETHLLPAERLSVPPRSAAGSSFGEDYLYRMHILRPGQSALIQWAAPMKVSEWTVNHDLGAPPEASVTIEAFDHAAHGVIDRTKVSVIARVLRPVRGRDAHWALTTAEPPEVQVVVWDTEREYRSEQRN